MNSDLLQYAGFWSRLGSLLLDLIIILPISALVLWGSSTFRFFNLYYFLPSVLFGLFYNVYLVYRFGGTPGKLILGICIRKLDGNPVGYLEAFLRFLPEFVFSLLISITLLFPLFQISDTEYHSLSFLQRSYRILELAPVWYKPLQWIQTAWVWGELVVLLTNRKRRALHDFIAGTIVIHRAYKKGELREPSRQSVLVNTIECQNCKAKVSQLATVCLNCGEPLVSKK